MSKKQETIRSIIRMQTPGKGQKSMLYSYVCECGKSYGSYPALYLHFKRTHHIKITTKISGLENQATRVKNRRVFTYYFSKKEEKSSENVCVSLLLRNSVEEVFQKFIKEAQTTLNYRPVLEDLIMDFQQFVLAHHKIKNLTSQTSILMEIPNFFNDFIQEKYLDLKEQQLYPEFCGILLGLGQWLRINGYTHYIVIPQQQP